MKRFVTDMNARERGRYVLLAERLEKNAVALANGLRTEDDQASVSAAIMLTLDMIMFEELLDVLRTGTTIEVPD